MMQQFIIQRDRFILLDSGIISFLLIMKQVKEKVSLSSCTYKKFFCPGGEKIKN